MARAKAINYEIEQREGPDGKRRWYLSPDGGEPVAFSTSRETVMEEAIRLTKGRGQIRVRDPKTGQWTDESR
ncbi:MAG: hypothetical protein ACYDCO_26550 [Armatimonadota bacterium]